MCPVVLVTHEHTPSATHSSRSARDSRAHPTQRFTLMAHGVVFAAGVVQPRLSCARESRALRLLRARQFRACGAPSPVVLVTHEHASPSLVARNVPSRMRSIFRRGCSTRLNCARESRALRLLRAHQVYVWGPHFPLGTDPCTCLGTPFPLGTDPYAKIATLQFSCYLLQFSREVAIRDF